MPAIKKTQDLISRAKLAKKHGVKSAAQQLGINVAYMKRIHEEYKPFFNEFNTNKLTMLATPGYMPLTGNLRK